MKSSRLSASHQPGAPQVAVARGWSEDNKRELNRATSRAASCTMRCSAHPDGQACLEGGHEQTLLNLPTVLLLAESAMMRWCS